MLRSLPIPTSVLLIADSCVKILLNTAVPCHQFLWGVRSQNPYIIMHIKGPFRTKCQREMTFECTPVRHILEIGLSSSFCCYLKRCPSGKLLMQLASLDSYSKVRDTRQFCSRNFAHPKGICSCSLMWPCHSTSQQTNASKFWEAHIVVLMVPSCLLPASVPLRAC